MLVTDGQNLAGPLIIEVREAESEYKLVSKVKRTSILRVGYDESSMTKTLLDHRYSG